jgi:hypothetical protein
LFSLYFIDLFVVLSQKKVVVLVVVIYKNILMYILIDYLKELDRIEQVTPKQKNK